MNGQSECGRIEQLGVAAHGHRSDELLKKHIEVNLQQYKDHFVQPTAEFIKDKTEVFQIDRQRIDEMLAIFACGLRSRLRFHPIKRFDPTIYEVEPFIHRLTPKSLDHLKHLVGIPNEVYAGLQKRSGGCGDGVRLRTAEMHHLGSDKTITFNRLTTEQRVAVRDLSFNLLMGFAEVELTRKAPYASVVDYMLGRVINLPTFVGKDLLVCPDETVEFSGFAAIYFDNVVVVGNGKIILGDSAKLHAYQIKHI